MMDMEKLDKILEAKERRSIKQHELINKYKASLISFTLNIPGEHKVLERYTVVHSTGVKLIEQALKENRTELLYIEERNAEAGREAFIVCSSDAVKLKKLFLEIEDKHVLGRLFDIDVFDENFNQISRTQFGKEKRNCLLCDSEAAFCIRNKSHSLYELMIRIDELIESYTKVGGIL
jgi:holo-ACP synthase